MKKLSIVFTAVIVLAASLSAQSLVELARREKARRETFKGRHIPIRSRSRSGSKPGLTASAKRSRKALRSPRPRM